MNGLNLGCGSTWRDFPGYDGLDVQDFGQAYVMDVRDLPTRPELTGYDRIISYHMLEHLTYEEVAELLRVVWERLVDGGTFTCMVPHKDKDEAWTLTHRSFYTKATFSELSEEITRQELHMPEWNISELVVNNRLDIYCQLKKGG